MLHMLYLYVACPHTPIMLQMLYLHVHTHPSCYRCCTCMYHVHTHPSCYRCCTCMSTHTIMLQMLYMHVTHTHHITDVVLVCCMSAHTHNVTDVVLACCMSAHAHYVTDVIVCLHTPIILQMVYLNVLVHSSQYSMLHEYIMMKLLVALGIGCSCHLPWHSNLHEGFILPESNEPCIVLYLSLDASQYGQVYIQRLSPTVYGHPFMAPALKIHSQQEDV